MSRPQAVRWVFPVPLVTPLVGVQVVGRDDGCDTLLAGNEVSRRHAEFRVDGPIAAVRDLQSRNGVLVNGTRRADASLAAGDVLRCGEWIGVVTAAASDEDGFREIAPGCFGGATLAAALAPVRQSSADVPVIVQGEDGTGKEVAARAIHAWGGRSGPFVPVDCAALDPQATSADPFDCPAPGTTLFLDGILDLPPARRPGLLRALEDRLIDVRIITATTTSPNEDVANCRFPADLHGRLHGPTVVLPPLRARREDIPPLFLEFLRQQCGGQPPALEPRLVERLCLHHWPQNLRELALLARRLLERQGHEPVLRKNFLLELQ